MWVAIPGKSEGNPYRSKKRGHVRVPSLSEHVLAGTALPVARLKLRLSHLLTWGMSLGSTNSPPVGKREYE